MSYENTNPREAHGLMEADDSIVYLDVRSTQEYESGHAVGAINIPIAHLGPGGMEPNEDFIKVVEANLSKDTSLVVGCKMGGRSARACEMLAGSGYTDLRNIDGGFSGRPDAPDESAQLGWQGSDLPVSTDVDTDSSYEALKSKA